MKVTFQPSICKSADGVAPAYEGSVTIRMPTYDERMGLYEAYGVTTGDEGAAQAKPLAFIRYVAQRASEHVTDVAIKRLDDGYEFKTFEELNYDSEMASVITEVAMKLVGKFQVGKTSSPS